MPDYGAARMKPDFSHMSLKRTENVRIVLYHHSKISKTKEKTYYDRYSTGEIQTNRRP